MVRMDTHLANDTLVPNTEEFTRNSSVVLAKIIWFDGALYLIGVGQ